MYIPIKVFTMQARENLPIQQKDKPLKLYNSTIKESNLKKIKMLVEKRADINSTDSYGKTALWWAAFNGNIELVQFLIDKKADPNLADNQGQTPLDIASRLALGGYREPDEINLHSKIANLLKPITRRADKFSNDDMSSITEKMSKLGIYASKTDDQNKKLSQQDAKNSETPCMIL